MVELVEIKRNRMDTQPLLGRRPLLPLPVLGQHPRSLTVNVRPTASLTLLSIVCWSQRANLINGLVDTNNALVWLVCIRWKSVD